MNAETEDKPKCLMKLAGKPLLEWQTSALRAAGIEDISVVRGYHGALLENYGLGQYENPRWNETNMVVSLMCASDALAENGAIVSYSDIAYHPSVVKILMGVHGDISMVYDSDWLNLWSERFHDPLEDAETFREKDGLLLSIGKKPGGVDEIEGQFIGLFKFTRAGWQRASRILGGLDASALNKLDVTGMLNLLLDAKETVHVAPICGRWIEADNGSDIELYEKKISNANSGVAWSHDWRW